jgi:hypothetical protein
MKVKHIQTNLFESNESQTHSTKIIDSNKSQTHSNKAFWIKWKSNEFKQS